MLERFGVVLLLVVACGGKKPIPSKGEADEADRTALSMENEVLKAVALHELGDIDLEKPVCLAARGAPDIDALRAQVRAKYRNTVANEECSGGGPDGSSVRAPGGPGVRIDIGPVTIVTEHSASCNGGGAYVSGGAREIRYIVENKGGTWTVTHEKIVMEM